MTVADASAVVAALVDTGPKGDAARRRLQAEPVLAPEVLDLEVSSALRGLVRSGVLAPSDAATALRGLLAAPIERFTHRGLLDRVWSLRDNLTPYDASYVALAELFDTSLLTGDARLSRAPGIRCAVELIS